MTVAEKVTQLIGGIGGGITPAVPSVGVPAYQYHSEGLHGLRDTCGLGKGATKLYSTMFPQVGAGAGAGARAGVLGGVVHVRAVRGGEVVISIVMSTLR